MSGEIRTRLSEDMKVALRGREKDRLQLIRMLISDLDNESLALARDRLSNEEEIAVLRRAAKVRKDEIGNARKAGRDDTAKTAEQELRWIEAYLPEQMDEAEIEAKARELIAELGISSRKEQGRFMKEWMSRYKAVSDGRIVNAVLGRLLD